MAALTDIVDGLKAAGESTRLRLLALLSSGELSVKDLTEIVQQSQPRVSRHLRLLTEAGLADRHTEGAWVYYRLAPGEGLAEMVRQIVRDIDPEDPLLAADRQRLDAVRADQRSRASAFFASVAESWDRLRELHVADSAVETAILEGVGSDRMARMLDLGTGTGRMLELLSDLYGHGTGIDSSREMIAMARAKFADDVSGKVTLRVGDIEDLSPYHGSADLVVIHQVLHFLDDPSKALAEASACLLPGGRAIVVDFAPHDHDFLREEQAHRRLGISDAQLSGWAASAGLAIQSKREFPSSGNGGRGLTVCLWMLSRKGPAS